MATFNPQKFLAQVGKGKTTLTCPKKRILFSQGDAADAVFYIQTGQVSADRDLVGGQRSDRRDAGARCLFGEGCLAGQSVCMATATAAEKSTLVRIDKQAMIRVLHDEPTFSELFLAYLLSRNIRIQEDLVDQLFNSSEKRLARVLLLTGPFRERRQVGRDHSEGQSRSAGRNDRHHALPRQFLHE